MYFPRPVILSIEINFKQRSENKQPKDSDILNTGQLAAVEEVSRK